MAYISINPNPNGLHTGDCVVRALAYALDKTWYEAYLGLAVQGLIDADMPSSNRVWSDYLKSQGYEMRPIINNCSECYTVIDFCRDHPHGKFVLATGNHALVADEGNYYDAWDSGREYPIFYFEKKEIKTNDVS